MKVAKTFETILLNPIQIWLTRIYKIHIHENTRTWQDFNPNPCLFLVIVGDAKDKEQYFLQKVSDKLEEMTESEGERKNGS